MGFQQLQIRPPDAQAISVGVTPINVNVSEAVVVADEFAGQYNYKGEMSENLET